MDRRSLHWCRGGREAVAPQGRVLTGLRSCLKGTSQRPKYGHFQTNSCDQQGPTPFERTPIDPRTAGKAPGAGAMAITFLS